MARFRRRAGGTVALPETDRQSTHDYVERNWTDLRPKSLIAQLGES